jgi:hypothetical protein
MKNFVAVRTAYSKRAKALAELDHAHAQRNGFTNSVNVIGALSYTNFGRYRYGASSCTEAFLLVEKMHEARIKKRIRNDFNALFEHVLIFSEELYSELERRNGSERMRSALTILLERYADQIQAEYGFEPLGFDVHLDEGFFDAETGLVRRNVHGHVQFYAFDFMKHVAPLRHLMKKGLNEDGRTNQLNPHFSRFQDIAADVFQKIGFRRGISKNVTGSQHLRKETFVMHKLQQNQLALKTVSEEKNNLDLEMQLRKIELEQLNSSIDRARQIRNKLSDEIADLSASLKSLIAATKYEARRILDSVLAKITKVEEWHRKNTNNGYNKTK